MEKLEEKLGYTFHDRRLLENALTHSSYANENKSKGETSNERLEFLGDSVLGMVVADHLYRAHPDMPEGELTRTRAALVCEDSLVEVAARLELGQYLKLGRGEDAGGGRKRPSIQADAVEAVIAAVYLDGGIGSARKRRPCWRRSIWTGESARPGRSSSALSWTGRRRRGPTGTSRPPSRSWCSGRMAGC